MGNIVATGGSWTTGDEAVEIGLWHVMNQHEQDPVSQVVLIADCPSQSAAETKSNRTRLGESLWAQTPYATMVTFDQQLDRIKQAEIPIHAFWVRNNTEKSFRSIASQTQGQCGPLDINSQEGAKQLTDIVCKRILASGRDANVGARLISR